MYSTRYTALGVDHRDFSNTYDRSNGYYHKFFGRDDNFNNTYEWYTICFIVICEGNWFKNGNNVAKDI